MKYEAPYGVTDTNAPYVNGNPATGTAGSIPPAAAIEYPQREIVNMIAGSGFGPTDADLQQLLKSTRSQFINYCADVGVANQLGGGFIPPIDSYTLGLPLRVLVAATNTGASTFDGGAGRHPIKRIDGSDTAAGDLPGGGLIELVWDGTNFQLINFMGHGGTGAGSTYTIKIPYIADTSSIANSIIAPFSPAITAPQAGDPILVKVANQVTGPTTMYVNSVPPVPAVNRFGGQLRPLDIAQGEIVLFIYTGAAWQLIGHDPETQTAVYNTPGTYTWTCPPGVFKVDVEVWGAGAAGCNSTQGPLAQTPGGTDGPGGNSGGYARKFALPVVPGTNYTVQVGQGGAPSYTSYGSAQNGTYSSFGSGSSAVTATGGAFVGNSWQGSGVGSGGDLNMTGGPGWVCQVTTGAYGWNGAYGFGGNAPGGGGCGGGPYMPGSWPGGGGGGGDFYGPTGSYPSGKGGDGGVVIRY